jgi:hypothetical protein
MTLCDRFCDRSIARSNLSAKSPSVCTSAIAFSEGRSYPIAIDAALILECSALIRP